MPKSFASSLATPLPPPFADIYFEVLPGIGSAVDDHRLTLRAHTDMALKKLGHAPGTNITDLTQSVKHTDLNLSFSHTMDASVFAWIEKPQIVGVDIEILERLQPQVVSRVSSPTEISTAPDMRYLWPAKEATFKAHSEHLKVVGEIHIHSWKRLDPSLWQFSARYSRSHERSDEILDGLGLVCLSPRHLLSFFVREGKL